MCDDVLGKEIKINLEFTGKSIRQLEAVRDGIDLIIERLKQVEDDCLGGERVDSQPIAGGIGANIKELRVKANLTQKELFIKTGVSVSYIQQIEKGVKANPSLDVLNKIATALDVSINDLIPSKSIHDSHDKVCSVDTLKVDLKKNREEADISQRELARRINMSGQMISKIERGETTPSLDTLNKIASALDVPVSSLFLNEK